MRPPTGFRAPLIVLFFAALAAWPTSARAAEPAASSPAPSTTSAPEPKEETRWYGGQTLLTDGAALASWILAAQATGKTQDSLALLGAGAYLLGGPLVHAAHGNPGRAAGSLALRIGLPVTGGMMGAALARCHQGEWFCGLGETALGVLLGMSTAIAFDAAVLARDTVPKEPSVQPMVRVGKNGAWAGIAGQF